MKSFAIANRKPYQAIIKPVVIAAFLAVALGITGCAQQSRMIVPTTTGDADLMHQNYGAADVLLTQAPWLKEDRKPMLKTSFVNINASAESSGLGRLISEQIANRLSQQGLTVVEIDKVDSVSKTSHDKQATLDSDRNRASNADTLIAGTYAVGRNTVYINARLVRTADNLILASYDYSLPLGSNTKALLVN